MDGGGGVHQARLRVPLVGGERGDGPADLLPSTRIQEFPARPAEQRCGGRPLFLAHQEAEGEARFALFRQGGGEGRDGVGGDGSGAQGFPEDVPDGAPAVLRDGEESGVAFREIQQVAGGGGVEVAQRLHRGTGDPGREGEEGAARLCEIGRGEVSQRSDVVAARHPAPEPEAAAGESHGQGPSAGELVHVGAAGPQGGGRLVR